MNMNSSKRIYIPFGLRGTVVGKTEDEVIVLFDEQFLSGTDIFGHCELYRGALCKPDHLLNLTKKFESQLKKKNNQYLLDMFTEKHPSQSHRTVTEVPVLSQDNSSAGSGKHNANSSAGSGKHDKRSHQ